jgi:hypothetical protein
MILAINSFHRKYIKDYFSNRKRYRSSCYSCTFIQISHMYKFNQFNHLIDISMSNKYIYQKVSQCSSLYLTNLIIKDILE